MGLRLLFLYVVVSYGSSTIAQAKTGNGGIGGPREEPIFPTTAPNLPGGFFQVNVAPPGPFLRDFTPPFPTNTWWQGLTLGKQENDLAGPFPFVSRTRNQGIEFGVPVSRYFEYPTLKMVQSFELSVGFTGIPNEKENHKCTGYDTQTVSIQYFNGASTMDTTLVPGSPYMTFKFTNAHVLIHTLGKITKFQWLAEGKAKLWMHAWTVTYLLYVVDGMNLTFTATDSSFTSTDPFTGTLRLAKVINNQQEAVLDLYAKPYATGMSMSYAVNGDESTQTWTWNVVGDAKNLLLMTWPHHRKALPSDTVYIGIEYPTIKGAMKGVLGNQWIQKHTLPTTVWTGKSPPHTSCVNELNRTLEFDVAALKVGPNPKTLYFWGGEFAKTAQMIFIAESIGRVDLIPRIVDILKARIQFWLETGHEVRIAYETLWGATVLPNNDINIHMNDHHFNNGYFLHGASILGKYDPAWLAQNIDLLNHMARDIGNPSPKDPHYPVTRCFDFFHGHSWASGIGEDGGSRGQESSSEAINGYYSLLLFGTVSNNQPLVDWARILLAMEMTAAKLYWHLYPGALPDATPYREQPFRDLSTVGVVRALEAGAYILFNYTTESDRRIKVAAIQILPITPMGFNFYDPEWMKGVLSYLKQSFEDTGNDAQEFKSVIYSAYSVLDPHKSYDATRWFINWGTGHSVSNHLYSLATQGASQGVPSTVKICNGSYLEAPQGLFFIQDILSKKYMLTGFNEVLNAKTTSQIIASKYRMGFMPGGWSIQYLKTKMFLSAGPEGTTPLTANKVFPDSHERFRWRKLSDGNYELTAMSNKALVQITENGELRNNGNASKFKLIPALGDPPVPVPAEGKLKNRKFLQYAVSPRGNPPLALTADKAMASIFKFVKVGANDDSLYAIRNSATGLAFHAQPDGNTPVAAIRNDAKSYEHFRLIQPPWKGGAYAIVHLPNGLALAPQADGTIKNNNVAVGDDALWFIE